MAKFIDSPRTYTVHLNEDEFNLIHFLLSETSHLTDQDANVPAFTSQSLYSDFDEVR